LLNYVFEDLRKTKAPNKASAEMFTPSAENISSTFEHIEGEVEALDEVIAGHGDFFMLIEALLSKLKYLFVLYVMMMMVLRMST
jgi:hypothetical protein